MLFTSHRCLYLEHKVTQCCFNSCGIVVVSTDAVNVNTELYHNWPLMTVGLFVYIMAGVIYVCKCNVCNTSGNNQFSFLALSGIGSMNVSHADPDLPLYCNKTESNMVCVHVLMCALHVVHCLVTQSAFIIFKLSRNENTFDVSIIKKALSREWLRIYSLLTHFAQDY